MKWNDKSKKLLLDSLENKVCKLKVGSNCTYVPLDKGVCAKLYKNKKQRDRCIKLQDIAATNSLAPKVGDKFSIKLFFINKLNDTITSHNMHGYLSQRVELRGVHLTDGKVTKIKQDLLDIGINHFDIRRDNVGYLNGSLVCIDFDTNSCHLNKQTQIWQQI